MASLSDNQELTESSAGTEGRAEHDSIGRGQVKPISAPVHPISQLQGPFEESIYEAIQGSPSEWEVDIDAQSRRRDLLENPQYERLCGRKWRQRADERYHPFWKLTAQMSFGLHLLVKKLAKSDAEVLKILQVHVDEVDGFISRTTEDFLIIQLDLRIRIQYLSLPLQNMDVFDEMLEDRNFRLNMLDYNEKIEHAIERFNNAVGDSLKDIQKGKEAIGKLWHYLGQSAEENSPLPNSLTAILNSMVANTEGWNATFSKLRRKGEALLSALSQLSRAVAEMQRRVGVASRKEVVSYIQNSPAFTRPKSSLRERLFDRSSSLSIARSLPLEKPLPCDPVFPQMMNPRPQSRGLGTRKMSQKSVPNLRAVREFEEHRAQKHSSSRARSVSNDSVPNAFLPKLPKSFTKRLSKARLDTNKSADRQTETIPSRPSTAASRVLRGFRRYSEEQQQQQIRQPVQPDHQGHRNMSPALLARRETMKNQLMQYFKSDKVNDAWETATRDEKKFDRPTTSRRKDGLWSRFHIKSSSVVSSEIQTNIGHDDLETQMAWLQEETKALNTYSLKPKYDTAPRLHVFSVQMDIQGLDKETECYVGSRNVKRTDADSQSIITALPAVSAPLADEHALEAIESPKSFSVSLAREAGYYPPKVLEASA